MIFIHLKYVIDTWFLYVSIVSQKLIRIAIRITYNQIQAYSSLHNVHQSKFMWLISYVLMSFIFSNIYWITITFIELVLRQIREIHNNPWWYYSKPCNKSGALAVGLLIHLLGKLRCVVDAWVMVGHVSKMIAFLVKLDVICNFTR